MVRIVVALVAFLAVPLWAAELPVNSRLGGEFELSSTKAGITGVKDFRGKVVLLNFGYTHCPDICPMVLNRMAVVMKELGKQRSQVAPLFVTFDPERDTLDRLSQYLNYFGDDFVGFTGGEDALAEVAKKYGVIAIPSQSDSAAGTLFSHSDYVYLLDQKGRVRALYGKSDSIDKIVDGVESLLDD